ncbi:MAG: site-specific DNA-methyltransferase [Candidatus Paceibacterota bacterium]|jgi:adenine-specific DNA-methyltransferase
MARKINYDNWSKEELIKELRRIKETKYGLVWHRDLPEEKIDILINPDARTPNEMFPNEMVGRPFPVLKEAKSKEINDDQNKPVNLLIEGDNYHSLAVLNFTNYEAVDFIYIDPPYNTGNDDFIYNDKRVDKEDPFRHSKWLNFMEKRLKLARNLLKPDGVMFISIGNDELAQLKMMCDEIFGELNLVEVISRVAKTASNKGTQFSPSVDYLLCYTKDLQQLGKFKDIVTDDWVKLFNREDKRGKYREISLYQAALDVRPNQNYFIICPDGSKARPPKGKVYRWTEKTFLENFKNDRVVFKKAKNSPLLDDKGKKSVWNIYTKTYLSDREEEGKRPRNFLDEFINRRGADLLSEMGIDFNYSKPVNLIKYLIQITNKPNDITILDFFAGSGTTGHALLELNKEDGGKRRFILCTNNEDNNGSGLKIASDICYPRLNKAIEGYKGTKGEKVKGLGGNLKYYTCDFVEAEPTDRNKRKLVNESTEMLCIKESAFELIQDESDFKIFKNSDKYLGIVFYEEAIDDFKKAIKKIKGHFNVYVFSLGDDPHEKQFMDVRSRVTLCAIPEVILKVYREIFK